MPECQIFFPGRKKVQVKLININSLATICHFPDDPIKI